ncbi:MAG: ATP-dependent DNA helicase RecG [candidate division Zixibacteria bacterium]|nr:ATP-dependent DNA helicase RecG [candidate division Zixibacteria bacterium]
MYQDNFISDSQKKALDFLFSDVKYLKGIGPAKAKVLKDMKINSTLDLFFYIPRKYLDYRDIKPISKLKIGETASVIGQVVSSGFTHGRRRRFIVYIQDKTANLELVWFSGYKYLESMITAGDVLSVTGKVGFYNGFQISHPEFDIVSGDDDKLIHTQRIIPVYPETASLKQVKLHSRGLRKVIKNALEQLKKVRCETLPENLRMKYGLLNLAGAISQTHFPDSVKAAEQGIRRLAFEELFYIELLLAARHNKRTAREPGISFPPPKKLGRKLLDALDFELTRAQKKVLKEIYNDMEKPHPMNRLLQGDVGSGKTIVAILTMLGAVEAGYQAALMAPTEILAEQHGHTLSGMLDDFGIEAIVITGSMPEERKQTALKKITNGKADVIIGTHALIQGKVKFKNLGLIVIDEQHKFGVAQRGMLQKKGLAPDTLVMTATPIPRTLAMTVYGDLDVSVINQMPAGRKPIKTAFVPYEKREGMYKFIRNKIKSGQQAYILYPLVEESEKLDLKAARESYEMLSRDIFPDLKLALLHGRMKGKAKNKIMMDFKDGAIDIIIATTVIEVGLDVANANIMVIEHAERFGLSQLHQLRGRIGRGHRQSYCFLLSDTNLSKEAEERIKILCSTNDGFKIAEADMSIRGPGEIMGTRQHGLPELKVASLFDTEMLLLARKSAFELLSNDEMLMKPKNRLLREALIRKFEKKIKYSKIA